VTSRDDVVYFGTGYGGYAVPTTLVKGSIGLSFGAEEDISFELGIARALCAVVHIFDPTPRSIDYCRHAISEHERSRSPGRIVFHPYGVWSTSTSQRFYAPPNSEHVSHSILNLHDGGNYFEAECLSPKEILHRLNLGHIEFVKINVEGAEYSVVDAMLEARIKPNVICLTFDELHSPMDSDADQRMRDLVHTLREESYLPTDARSSKVTFVKYRGR
jgi:FkbM family methyltransferase